MRRLHGLLVALALGVPAAAVSPVNADDWVDYATVSMTDPITPKLVNRSLCYTDGVDIACDEASATIATGGLLSLSALSVAQAITAGAVYTSGTVQVSSTGYFDQLFVNGSAVGTGNLSGSGSATAVAYWNTSTTLAYDSDGFFWNPTSNYLGVGTNTPTAALDINGSGRATFIITARSTGSQNFQIITDVSRNVVLLDVGGTGHSADRIHLGDEVTNVNAVTTLGKVGIGMVTPTASLQVSGTFAVSTSAQDTTPSFYVASNGRVGLGTSSPIARLDVAGTISASDAIQVSGSTLTCASAIRGALRYDTTGDTLQVCNAAGWVSLVSAASGLFPAGTTADVQFNSSGALAAHTGVFTYAGGLLSVPTVSASNAVNTTNLSATAIYNPGSLSGNTIAANSVSSSRVSASTVSATLIQPGQATNTCGTEIAGAIRYNSTSNTLQICNAVGWVSLVSATSGVFPAGTTGDVQFNTSGTLAADTGKFFYSNGGLNVSGSLGGYYFRDRTVGIGRSALYRTGNKTYLWNSDSGENPFAIDNTTNYVGIGTNTTTPQATLHVSGTFTVSTSAQATTPTLAATGTGRVGVRTGTPAYELDVAGTANATNVSASTVSATLIQPGQAANMCASAIAGAIRYNVTSNTLQVCSSTGWKSLVSDTTGLGPDNLGNHIATQNLDLTGAYKISFGSTTGDKLNLYSNTYGIGVESNTLTNWSSSRFRWRIGGTSVASGTEYMSLTTAGLVVAGYVSTSGAVDIGTQALGNVGDSASTPTYSWSGDTNTGVFTPGADMLALTAGGSERVRVTAAGISTTLRIYDGDGTAPLPAYSFAADTNIGLYRPAADSLGLVTDGLERVRVDSAGRVGIGTIAPSTLLDVLVDNQYAARLGRNSIQNLTFWGNSGGNYIESFSSLTAIKNLVINATSDASNTDPTVGNSPSIVFQTLGLTRMSVHGPSGNVMIGSGTPAGKLVVQGTISATDAVQVGSSSLTCAAAIAGAIRYNATSNTLQICSGSSGWKSLVSDTTGLGPDNLGNHTATQNLDLTGAYKITFGGATGDKLNLYSNTYGIGVENNTLTNWSQTRFRWRVGGTSVASGTEYMSLTTAGLVVAGYVSTSGAVDIGTQALGNAGDSASAPTYSWSGDTNTGVFTPGADMLAVAAGGSERVRVTAAGISTTLRIYDGDGSAALPAYSFAADTNIGLYRPATDALGLVTDGLERVRVDSTGRVGIGIVTPTASLQVSGTFTVSTSGQTTNPSLMVTTAGEILSGYTSALKLISSSTSAEVTPSIQNHSTSLDGASLGLIRWNNAAGSPYIVIGKARSGAIGTFALVPSGDTVGVLSFVAADGSGMLEAARVSAAVDATSGAGDMPGRLVFSTTPDGATTTTERMRITNAGYVGISQTNPTRYLDVNGTVRFGNASLNTWATDPLLELAIRQPWYFGQAGTGGNSNLRLYPSVDDTAFAIQSQDRSQTALIVSASNVPGASRVGINTYNPATTLDISGTARATAFTQICPAGFTQIGDTSKALGCMQTNQNAAATWPAANDACFDSYVGRLPTGAEWHIAAANYTLTGETGDWEWLADVVGETSAYDNHAVVGMTGISDFSWVSDTTSVAYRCFIPN